MYRPRAFFRPLDVFILILIAAASAWGFLAFRMEAGASVDVFIGNRKYGWYKLEGAQRQIPIPTSIGPVILEIGSAGARVSASPCRNKVCVKTGRVAHAGSEIICMPARLLVIVGGGGKGKAAEGGHPPLDGTDAVTY